VSKNDFFVRLYFWGILLLFGDIWSESLTRSSTTTTAAAAAAATAAIQTNATLGHDKYPRIK